MLERDDIRNLTKIGMVTSMAILVWTGLGRGYINLQLHTIAGIALIGFSVWHYNVYRPPHIL
ncbi:MAG: hypothetical protein QMC83_05045 [Thermodesulfovibrionales bacterium]|nr:hypothetical protein [Thermodesulfovibrionales bacterium]